MDSRPKTHLVTARSALALAAIFFLAPSARADQIIELVDEHGHRVYINTGEPAAQPAYWKGRHAGHPRNPTSIIPPADIQQLVLRTADKHRIDPYLVHAIIKTESDYNPHAVSRKGAMGLMQLIPSTAQLLGVSDPFDPQQNIEGGVSYLKYLMQRFGGDVRLSLAAYNAGEKSVLRAGGVPRFAETRDYVRKVTRLYNSKEFPAEATAGSSRGEPPTYPIRSYTDEQGVVHFTNVD